VQDDFLFMFIAFVHPEHYGRSIANFVGEGVVAGIALPTPIVDLGWDPWRAFFRGSP
jgi:hypothetical protein